MQQRYFISEIDVQSYNIPIGLTVGLYFGQSSRQVTTRIDMPVAGGTLYLLAAPDGTTMPGASLLAAIGASKGLVLTAGMFPMEFQGPITFYLAAIGATTPVVITKGLSPSP